MKNIDLSILKKKPEPNLEVILEIQPLAPLSMVSEIPGSYYKTLKSPSKKIICGLFENILGWHFSLKDRKMIIQELDFLNMSKGSSYIPLLWEYFEIKLYKIPERVVQYDDLWSRSFRRTDSYRHTLGVKFMDSNFISKWTNIKKRVEIDTKRKSRKKNSLLDKLFKRYIGNFPMYYSTPTKREFIQYDGSFQILISIDSYLFEQLDQKVQKENIGYLGTNEGWVNINFKNLQ